MHFSASVNKPPSFLVMPKKPSRKLPIQQHGLATVLHTFPIFFPWGWQISSLLELLYAIYPMVLITLKVMRGCHFFSSWHFAFVVQSAWWLHPGPVSISKISHEVLGNIQPLYPLWLAKYPLPISITSSHQSQASTSFCPAVQALRSLNLLFSPTFLVILSPKYAPSSLPHIPFQLSLPKLLNIFPLSPGSFFIPSSLVYT